MKGFISLPNKKANPLLKFQDTGFTLIEMLVVVAIIGILAAISVSIYSGAQNKARDIKKKADIDTIAKAYEMTYDIRTNSYDPSKAVFPGGGTPIPPSGGSYACQGCTTGSPGFKICTTLDDGTAYCVNSSASSLPTVTPIPTSPPTPTPNIM